MTQKRNFLVTLDTLIMHSLLFPSVLKSFRRTTPLSFGISSFGSGTYWTKAFNMSILGPVGPGCMEKWKGATGSIKKSSTGCSREFLPMIQAYSMRN